MRQTAYKGNGFGQGGRVEARASFIPDGKHRPFGDASLRVYLNDSPVLRGLYGILHAKERAAQVAVQKAKMFGLRRARSA